MPVISCFSFVFPPPDLELPLAIRASSSVGASPQAALVPKWQRSDRRLEERNVSSCFIVSLYTAAASSEDNPSLLSLVHCLSYLQKCRAFVRLCHTRIIISIVIVPRHPP